MSDFTEDAMRRAQHDGAVQVLDFLMRAVDLVLPESWATWAWNNVLVPLQDAAYLSSVRWHAYLAGCRGRRP